MSHQLTRLKLARLHDLEQHRRRHRVDEPGGQGDIAIPKLLEVQLYRFAVDADVRNPPTRRDAMAAVYDPAGDRMVVFGGWSGERMLDDTWFLSWGGTGRVASMTWASPHS